MAWRGTGWLNRPATLAIATAGLVAALAAILMPASTQVSEIAAVLGVASLAILAGHQWGLMVLVAADVVLLGRVWPLVVHEWPPTVPAQMAAYAALAGALPGLFLLRRTVPHWLDLVLGAAAGRRWHATGSVLVPVASALWLLIPMFYWPGA